jgi:hypothetical protein
LLEDLVPALEQLVDFLKTSANSAKKEKVLETLYEQLVPLRDGLETLASKSDDEKTGFAKLKMSTIKAQLASNGLLKSSIDILEAVSEEKTK